jgi:hypothetical protein
MLASSNLCDDQIGPGAFLPHTVTKAPGIAGSSPSLPKSPLDAGRLVLFLRKENGKAAPGFPPGYEIVGDRLLADGFVLSLPSRM